MKKYFLASFACIFLTATAFAQTHKIMHRSHGGSDRSSRYDENSDNFGINEAAIKRWQEQDSIKTAQKKADSIEARKVKGPGLTAPKPKKK